MDAKHDNDENRKLIDKAITYTAIVAGIAVVLHYTTPLVTDWIYSK